MCDKGLKVSKNTNFAMFFSFLPGHDKLHIGHTLLDNLIIVWLFNMLSKGKDFVTI